MFWKKEKCKACSSDVKENWNYCPTCGQATKERNVVGNGNSVSLSGPFGVKISFRSVGEDNTSGVGLAELKVREQLVEQAKLHGLVESPKVTEEPSAEIKKDSLGIVFKISLPGVQENSIELRRLPNSLELKAIAGNKLYFKVFEVPQNLVVVERKFEPPLLIVRMG
ncbi:MAG: zinc ribbon domain-containing protein [Candidatus Aenigmarchaeota archaeon]|nr:zinc ribbon domain-containing protein [Candidatus Aenigmarchaeota archaeon]